MKKYLFLLLIFAVLFPFQSAEAFDLWDSRVINETITLEPYGSIKILATTDATILGIQITTTPTFVQAHSMFYAFCDGSPLALQSYLSPNIFYPFNINCLAYQGSNTFEVEYNTNLEFPESVIVSVFYTLGTTGDATKDLITGNTGEFYVDKTLSYGDILILFFLIIFFVALVGKLLWNFHFKDLPSKL